MCAGGIHDSGSRPINSSSRRCRASAQSVFARFFLPFSAAGLGRLGQMHLRADPLRAPRPRTASPSSPPTRPRDPRPAKRAKELPHPGTVRRRDPRARDLAGDRVDPLRRDLRPMLIQTHHDRHQTTSPRQPRRRSTRRQRQPGTQPIAYREPRSVPPVRMAGRAAAIRARLQRRSTRRTGHLHRPRHANRDMTSFGTAPLATATSVGWHPRREEWSGGQR